MPYEPNIKGRLITDPETFSRKLDLLSKKLVKDQFETEPEFRQRGRQEIESFQKAESLKFREVFVLGNFLNAGINNANVGSPLSNYNYNADKKTLVIRSSSSLRFPNKTTAEILSRQDRYVTNFQFSFLSPETQKISDSDVENYWLNKKSKIDIRTDEIIVSDLEPSYAKQLLSENRLVLLASFTMPFYDQKSDCVVGYLLGLKIVDHQNNQILWSLN